MAQEFDYEMELGGIMLIYIIVKSTYKDCLGNRECYYPVY